MFTSPHIVEDFITKIYSKKCITYELCPEKSGSVVKLVEKVQKVKLHDMQSPHNSIDGFVCTDSPLAILKQNSGLASIKLQQKLHKPLICTISMRDRNSLALSAEIMGLNDFDIRIFLALSGDPIKLGDQPQAKAIFEGNSLRILEILSCLNQAKDLNENPIKEPLKKLYGFSVINSYAKKYEILKNKMESKIKAGALALFTQPIYDVNVTNMLLEWLEEFNERHNSRCILMQGFFPVVRYKSAVFLHDKLPGVFIPTKWIEVLEKAQTKGVEYERQKGMEMSIELFNILYKNYPKIHFMNNNNTIHAKKILDTI
ncbi:5,10-methylenetetrahydrofolate reductase [Helicobacter didelphidarum]|uniref:Methylenetetrahydrofolate reductase n=1 Tax=Helicobacter didelphidarum TaxID=2040648 RepID=A0A3D8IG32_9HELI|nr:methylenetetrahydrofolate reductase [Helicobacter didelphidarum]RDU64060.1 5,10-methylenetetrahydrofolate reductase [Helicobacter didelphidarum]